ncbi:Short chain dehydrogenase yanD [Frankliniella fusca]|uniref:Short chain dehydrogenase yanD n=1 Tax=Frankliniella fusca TaxID=407009 RepID=A0AAE1H4N8_9NEOP|nr:Short chain dehydrogenase yanD [Frankliniella fusca]KAK3928904.1 Short chain dehydrogenase yanD [Frankliniella fusca]
MSASRRMGAKKPRRDPDDFSFASKVLYNFLEVSPVQLRELWDFDNECASHFGAPFRKCSTAEDDNEGAISPQQMEAMKATIKNIWDDAMSFCEIFCDPNRKDLGYRIRIKPSLVLKVTLKQDSPLYFGWCAKVPERLACPHIYRRSPLEAGGPLIRNTAYMGGPASYCNWAQTRDKTCDIVKPQNRTLQKLVRLECSNLSSGTELMWNYGMIGYVNVPEYGPWFLDKCCFVIPMKQKTMGRHEKKKVLAPFIRVEHCVLCGKQFPFSNKESRVQMKPHFINSHADFLGSMWDSLSGPYRQEEVDASRVLAEADKLGVLLNTLTKKLKWKVTPACTVMSTAEKEHYSEDDIGLKEDFLKRCDVLKAAGVLVMRGMVAMNRSQDVTPQHLMPVPPSKWRVLTWKVDPPLRGRYGAPHGSKHQDDVQACVFNFCRQSLQTTSLIEDLETSETESDE